MSVHVSVFSQIYEQVLVANTVVPERSIPNFVVKYIIP